MTDIITLLFNMDNWFDRDPCADNIDLESREMLHDTYGELDGAGNGHGAGYPGLLDPFNLHVGGRETHDGHGSRSGGWIELQFIMNRYQDENEDHAP